MRVRWSIAALALITISSPASAADFGLYDNEPIATSAAASGLYIGAYGGMGAANLSGVVDSSEIDDGFPEEAEIFPDTFSTGPVFGGLIGFRTWNGDLVYGVEADLGLASISSFTEDDGANDNATQQIDWVGTLRGVVGKEVGNGITLNLTGGLAVAGLSLTASNDNDSEVGTASFVSFGAVVGLGVEKAVTEQVSLRLEGLYFTPMTPHEFADSELTPDMDAGDFAQMNGMFQVRASALFHF